MFLFIMQEPQADEKERTRLEPGASSQACQTPVATHYLGEIMTWHQPFPAISKSMLGIS